jgi:hypothetical protein
MPELKKIPTFSWLVRKTEALMKRDPVSYRNLRQAGTSNLLRGCVVKMNCKDTGNEFVYRLFSPKDTIKTYATISGHKERGELYTVYHLNFTTTQYRKRMHKWLPVSMPMGVRCGLDSVADYFNADGTEAYRGKWHGGRERRSGRPDCDALVIRDRDGKLMANLAYTGEHHQERCDVIQHLHGNNPVDLWHDFLPGSCLSKLDWYKSMVPPEFDNHDLLASGGVSAKFSVPKVDEPVWNEMRVKTLAAKVHSEAIRLTKTYPHIKIAMFPGCKFVEGEEVWTTGIMSRFSGGNRNPVVVGRDDKGEPLMWVLPELVLYWVAPRHETGHKVHAESRFIRVIIPPAGSRQLLRTDGKSSLTCTYRWGSRNLRMLEMNVIHRGQSIERAHHQLIGYSVGQTLDGSVWNYGRNRSRSEKFGDHVLDDKVHNWDESQAVVLMYEQSDNSGHYWGHYEGRVAKPEGIFNHIEERELVDSLPLC